MGSRRRLVYYLLINVFVTVLVAGAVIFYYDRYHHVACTPARSGVATISAVAGDVKVQILGVMGAGTLADELMIIRNDGANELVLTGWYVMDNRGQSFSFPQLTLHPGVEIELHSKTGQNTPTDLYWGRSTAAWASGELAALYDAQNIVRAFYRVP